MYPSRSNLLSINLTQICDQGAWEAPFSVAILLTEVYKPLKSYVPQTETQTPESSHVQVLADYRCQSYRVQCGSTTNVDK